MRPGCAKADSVISSSCSGICQYTCNKSAQSPCGCLVSVLYHKASWQHGTRHSSDVSLYEPLLFLQSLDNSQELPVYIIKLARALQRVVQQNDADCHTVSQYVERALSPFVAAHLCMLTVHLCMLTVLQTRARCLTDLVIL